MHRINQYDSTPLGRRQSYDAYNPTILPGMANTWHANIERVARGQRTHTIAVQHCRGKAEWIKLATELAGIQYRQLGG